MRKNRSSAAGVLVVLAELTAVASSFVPFSAVAAESWLPIDPAELKMTREPKAPSASAIYLYRQVDRDDNAPSETIYARIKILTDEGKKYADVEVPFDKGRESVRAIEARTIRPDGTIVKFEGEIFQKPIVQGRGVKMMAVTFTLPDVQVGSIIEYKYTHMLNWGYVYDSHWILSQPLYTKYAKFSLVQSDYFIVSYSWPMGLPAGTEPPAKEKGRIRLETRDVPAFATEDFMPPENQMKYRVDFIYLTDDLKSKDAPTFWKKVAKSKLIEINSYVDDKRAMEQAVSQIVAPNDAPEVKLRKLYARTQQIRNTSFERRKTEEENRREKQREARGVGDVWKQGSGDGTQITWLYLALVRAAGFEADPVLVSTRDSYFFDERITNPNQLNSNVVWVKADGKEYYLDPGTSFIPFGLLPWSETGVRGLRLNKNGESWVQTPLPGPEVSRAIRKADLKLSNQNVLTGKVTVTYTGLEAHWRRLEERNEDATERKEFMEAQLREDIPTGLDVKLINEPNWNGSEEPLVAEYEVKIPGWATSAGQRALFTLGLFGEKEQHAFESANRIHPIYMPFSYQSEDDVGIELPEEWQVGSVPEAQNIDLKVVGFNGAASVNGQVLNLKRNFKVNFMIVDKKYYGQLRDFYQKVRTHDELQVVFTRNRPQQKR